MKFIDVPTYGGYNEAREPVYVVKVRLVKRGHPDARSVVVIAIRGVYKSERAAMLHAYSIGPDAFVEESVAL